MNEKEIQKFDEDSTMIENSFPNHWRSMYLNLVKEGFSEYEAMYLLKTYIQVMGK